jgi:hypothetical protein
MMMYPRVALLAAATATALTALVPATGWAQGTTTRPPLADNTWRPWLGCWTPIERAPRDVDIQVCIVPSADGSGVRMTTYAGDQQVLEETIAADGSTVPLNEADCRGSSSSRWASKGGRLFRVSELRCDGKAPQRTTEIATLEPSREWLDVQVTSVSGADHVRTRRYTRSTEPAPAAIADQLLARASDSTTDIVTIAPDDVVEAAAQTSPRAVEAWLSESTMHVPVNKRTLLAMHQANVPPHVIDLMVARAYPRHFEVRRSGSGGGSFGSFADDDFAWIAPLDSLFYSYAGFYYSPFGSYRYFVDPSLYPLGGYTIIPSDGVAVQNSGPGRVVNGSGYTRIEPRQPPVVVGRTSDGSTGNSFESGGSSSSSGSSSGSSSSGVSASPSGYSGGGGGGGGAQTALPR